MMEGMSLCGVTRDLRRAAASSLLRKRTLSVFTAAASARGSERRRNPRKLCRSGAGGMHLLERAGCGLSSVRRPVQLQSRAAVTAGRMSKILSGYSQTYAAHDVWIRRLGSQG